MNNLLTAIYGKTSGSAFPYFLDEAQEGSAFPYCVFSIVSAVPEKTFTEDYENVTIQFSLFSSSRSGTEITGMYAALMALFDECSLSISGSKLVWMRRTNLVTMVDEVATPDGSTTVKHWAVDYEVLTSKN